MAKLFHCRTLIAIAIGSFLASSVAADDTQLLRESGAETYLMVFIDTSESMVTYDIDGNPTIYYEESRLATAKRALYRTFKDVPEVNLGLVTYGGRDQLRVKGKHWLYRVKNSLLNTASLLVVPYPEIGTELLLGPSFAQPGGTCDDPLTDTEAIGTYSKLGQSGQLVTEQWVRFGGSTYRLQWENDSDSDPLGLLDLTVELTVEKLANGANACNGPTFIGLPTEVDIELELVGERLVMSRTTDTVTVATEQKGPEATNGADWDYQAVEGDYTCGPDRPFSSYGMEFNDDSGLDRLCTGDPEVCDNLLWPTTVDESGNAELSSGDAVFWHYDEVRREEVLKRFNPLHPGGEDFGAASFLTDQPDADTGFLTWKSDARRAILGGGNSPFSDAILDLRCWLSGPGKPKCRNDNLPFTVGFNALALENDVEWGICKQTYFLFVTDGENNCSGENPSADIAGFNRDLGTYSWVFNVEPKNSGAIQSIVKPGKGEVITVDSEQGLIDELQEVLGLILEEQRTFASAAIPTLSAEGQELLYITSFFPFNGTGYWDGHVSAFLKPLPLTALGRPDFEHPNFQWDAGAQLVLQAPSDTSAATTSSDLKLGSELTERRVYYPMAANGKKVPRDRQILGPKDALKAPTDSTLKRTIIDQWKGLGIVSEDFTVGDDAFETHAANDRWLEILRETYEIKEELIPLEDGSSITQRYILGDIFHSNPLVIGSPGNFRWFQSNYFGYREFASQQLRRRKVLIVCANDGFCHGFDAGVFRRDDAGFDRGTGRELFAIAPRGTMPAITDLAEGTSHRWGMDGTARVMDAFVDPAHEGTPTIADREWRTLMIAGARRGSRNVVAIDLTAPDPLETITDPEDSEVILGYLPIESDLPGNTDYPSVPWEFTDLEDEDGDGEADLGQTWSTPNLGVLKVQDGENVVDKFVAIFGGGFPPGGNYLYIVDIETGQAIYKRELETAATAEVAAIDTNQDGYLDRVYAGTLGGFVYRADIGTPQPIVAGVGPDNAYSRVTAADWEPRKIFDTGGRSIYFAPAVIFVGELGRYALAFGTGNRDNLWTLGTDGGERFYLFVDESDQVGIMQEADLAGFAPGAPSTDTNFLLDRTEGTRGWYLILDEARNERMLNAALPFPGLVVFSTFLPMIEGDTTGTGNNEVSTCVRTGVSRNYILFSDTGNAALSNELGERTRFQEVDDFLTDPYVEWRSTDQVDSSYQDPLDYDSFLKTMWDDIVKGMPRDCRVSKSQGFNISAIRSDTGVETLAAVPMCNRRQNVTD